MIDQLALGIGSTRRQFNGQAFLTVGVRVNIYKANAPPHPDQRQALIGHDSKKPRKELGIAVILVQMFKSLEACFLHFVLRVAPVTQYERSDIDAGSMVPADQNTECLPVPRTGL